MVWGEPTRHDVALSAQGRVILAGPQVAETLPSHMCRECRAEFLASQRIYRRLDADEPVFGVAVWPHGRKQVRIEAGETMWTVIVEGEGSMLIDRSADAVFPAEVFGGMWPWEVEDWARRRGFPIDVIPDDDGWTITMAGGSLFELLVAKAWWRTLGRDPVERAIQQLTSEASSPLWLPAIAPAAGG